MRQKTRNNQITSVLCTMFIKIRIQVESKTNIRVVVCEIKDSQYPCLLFLFFLRNYRYPVNIEFLDKAPLPCKQLGVKARLSHWSWDMLAHSAASSVSDFFIFLFCFTMNANYSCTRRICTRIILKVSLTFEPCKDKTPARFVCVIRQGVSWMAFCQILWCTPLLFSF